VARAMSMGMGEVVVNTTETSVILSHVRQHLLLIFFVAFFAVKLNFFGMCYVLRYNRNYIMCSGPVMCNRDFLYI
jgi:hypothetical protein